MLSLFGSFGENKNLSDFDLSIVNVVIVTLDIDAFRLLLSWLQFYTWNFHILSIIFNSVSRKPFYSFSFNKYNFSCNEDKIFNFLHKYMRLRSFVNQVSVLLSQPYLYGRCFSLEKNVTSVCNYLDKLQLYLDSYWFVYC